MQYSELAEYLKKKIPDGGAQKTENISIARVRGCFQELTTQDWNELTKEVTVYSQHIIAPACLFLPAATIMLEKPLNKDVFGLQCSCVFPSPSAAKSYQ
eukprot:10676750-Lingulodinium_polyedra.AAC.1